MFLQNIHATLGVLEAYIKYESYIHIDPKDVHRKDVWS